MPGGSRSTQDGGGWAIGSVPGRVGVLVVGGGVVADRRWARTNA